MGTISHRKFIRWLPDEASEPTSTLVLTSRDNRFVDIRVLLNDKGCVDSRCKGEFLKHSVFLLNEGLRHFRILGTTSIDALDWAIGGTVSSTTNDSGIRRAKFSHWINSRSKDADGVADEGDMYEQDDGTTLEKGSMVNPATGQDTAYEESWLDIEVAVNDDRKSCFVAKLDGNDCRGMVVMLDGLCQGVMRRGDHVAAERWERKNGAWTRSVQVGQGDLVCESMITDEEQFAVGHKIMSKEGTWQIVEAY